jgi:L-fuconolactonase
MDRIDAHQHFWRLSRGDYGWLTPELAAIYRDFLPEDLAPLLAKHGIAGTILVQAAPTDAETDYLLSLADSHDFIMGVVGWVDFEAPAAAERIGALARHAKLKGLRPMIQDIPDPDWMLRDSLDPAFNAMIEHDLTFDALVLPKHLDNLIRLVARHPDLRVVVDHCAKPDIAGGAFEPWAQHMRAIAQASPAFCKLSGLVTEAGPGWSGGDRLAPYVDHVLTAFGPERVIWGSDWPVCTLIASYDEWIAASDILLGKLGLPERSAVFGGNAARAYRVTHPGNGRGLTST